MKKLIASNTGKAILLIIISIIIFSAWEFGLEKYYEESLIGITNVTLPLVKKDTRITLENTKKDGSFQFRVYTRVQGRRGNYPQETGSLMQPFVIILSWQLFLFFVLGFKDALKLFGINVGIFVFLQILFLYFLSGYYNSPTQKFLFDMMLDNFYIIALILIIKDNIFYPVFRRQSKSN